MDENLNENNQDNIHAKSVKEWIVVAIINSIPVFNIIMWLIWAFSKKSRVEQLKWFKSAFASGDIDKKNMSRAHLLFSAIFTGALILFSIFFAIVTTVFLSEY